MEITKNTDHHPFMQNNREDIVDFSNSLVSNVFKIDRKFLNVSPKKKLSQNIFLNGDLAFKHIEKNEFCETEENLNFLNLDENNSITKIINGHHGTDSEVQDEKFKKLQKALANIQKKTFTKWCNSYLEKRNQSIDELYSDIGNGIILWHLLEILSGESLGKPNMAKHRVQKLENVNVCLTFLNAKVHLENIGSEDIVDGNERLILGLIWTIILRYQIDDISIDLTQEERQKLYKNEPKSKKYSDILDAKVTSKNALLIWCKRRTKGYHNVDIQNFSSSWKDGLGFLAIIHSYRPDLIDFEDYKTENANRNLKEAFEIAESYLGIYRLLDPEDVNSVYPDEKSILTYLSCLYHFFHNPKLLGKMSPDKKLKKIEIIGNSSLIENDQNIAKKDWTHVPLVAVDLS